MPIYDIHAVAHATDLKPKQVDNLLSRNSVVGRQKKRRGLARRVGTDTVVAIRIAMALASFFGVSVGAMMSTAENLASSTDGEIAIDGFLRLRIDQTALRASTRVRLDSAVESVGVRRRGRPGQRTR